MKYQARKNKAPRAKIKKRRMKAPAVVEILLNDKELIRSKHELEQMRREKERLQNELNTLNEKSTEINAVSSTIDINKIKTGNIITTQKRESLEREIREYESMLKNKETTLGTSSGNMGGSAECFVRNDKIDKSTVYQKMVRAKRMLSEGTHRKLSSADENKLNRRKKEIEDTLRPTYPSLSDCNSSDNAKTDEIAHYLLKHGEKYGAIIQELKNINKILDPSNPNAGRLTYLRKK